MLSNCGAGEDSWESLGQQGYQISQSWGKLTLNIDWERRVEAEAPITWRPYMKSWLIRKDLGAGNNWGWEGKGGTEDETVGRYHWLNGQEFEQTQEDSDGQRSLAV